MADLNKRLPTNAVGEFFVDSTCINCDTCRQLAPGVFKEVGDYSAVYAQPHSETETRDALRALLACPTGSIGTVNPNDAKAVMADFPLLLEARADFGVYYAGFNSPKSFGGNSYVIQDPLGNWLVDSPKFLPHMRKRLEALGGLSRIFLTHQDDVADAERFAEAFGAQRIIHEADRSAQPGAEWVLTGTEPVRVEPHWILIPTPGHTEGHCVLLYRERFLFTGDHLWWNPDQQALGASRSYCWYSWSQQIHSMERLLDYSFEWVLPGHGDRIHLEASVMRAALMALIDRMKRQAA